MADFRNRFCAAVAALLLASGTGAQAFENLDDEGLSGAGISQPDAAFAGSEAETAGEEQRREPTDEAELIRAGRMAPPPATGPRERISLKVFRG